MFEYIYIYIYYMICISIHMYLIAFCCNTSRGFYRTSYIESVKPRHLQFWVSAFLENAKCRKQGFLESHDPASARLLLNCLSLL